MDMVVRTQNRRRFADIKDLKIEQNGDKFVIRDYDIVGIYETEQRAMEVFDEIQNAFIGINVNAKLAINTDFQNNIAYQMPEE